MHSMRSGLATVAMTVALVALTVALVTYAAAADLRHNAAWILSSATSASASATNSVNATVNQAVNATVSGAAQGAATGAASTATAVIAAAQSKASGQIPSSVASVLHAGSPGVPSTLPGGVIPTLAPAPPSSGQNPVTHWLQGTVTSLPTQLFHTASVASIVALVCGGCALLISSRRRHLLKCLARYGLVVGGMGLVLIRLIPRLVHGVFGYGSTGVDLARLTHAYGALQPTLLVLAIAGGIGLVILHIAPDATDDRSAPVPA